MHMIDRGRVRDAFGRQAREYDTHATVQKRVIARFVKMLEREGRSPRRLLDVGSGTGMLLCALREVFGDAVVIGVDLAPSMSRTANQKLAGRCNTHFLAADAEHLPFTAEGFDLVLSTSTFQWLTHLDMAFGEAFRVLAPGGLFCFSLFGGRTLYELRNSYREALAAAGCPVGDRSHSFFSEGDVAAALELAGFEDCRTMAEQDVEIHANVPSLLRSLKRIGAGSASPVAGRGLAGKGMIVDMMERYGKGYGKAAGIPATYEIIYGIGKKPF